MKRKQISNLMQIEEPIGADELLQLLPEDGNDDTASARIVLGSALQAARRNQVTDPAEFYYGVCSTTAAQLQPALEGTPAAALSKAKIIRAQTILKEVLTSKAGRPASADGLSRAEQLAAGQRRRRQKLAVEEGRKQLNVYISADAAAYLAAIQEIHRCESRADALEKVLQAAIQGQILTPPPKS
jgi:hypothetical protein